MVLAAQHVEEPPGFDAAACDSPLWFGSCILQLQRDRDHVRPTSCTTPGEVHDFIAYAVARYNVDPSRVDGVDPRGSIEPLTHLAGCAGVTAVGTLDGGSAGTFASPWYSAGTLLSVWRAGDGVRRAEAYLPISLLLVMRLCQTRGGVGHLRHP